MNVWQKPLQYCKVISLQLIKINGKKGKKKNQWQKLYLIPNQKELKYFTILMKTLIII